MKLFMIIVVKLFMIIIIVFRGETENHICRFLRSLNLNASGIRTKVGFATITTIFSWNIVFMKIIVVIHVFILVLLLTFAVFSIVCKIILMRAAFFVIFSLLIFIVLTVIQTAFRIFPISIVSVRLGNLRHSLFLTNWISFFRGILKFVRFICRYRCPKK
ncbi:hypothetical protein TRFO_30559 [Tritrichomonas foetus]|uniref:Uncharacterized protein n=1 Tax=Tritrichomonas foetus TaxID=1144522 RepID=A0A1J4JYL8_9EUKA|nr:hypothetical protein TRFO_30559 [Tritrichomonas foetus]|eukprot:OHT02365.1 hypothetical protein TRFO_30559 [Tritrichomonas foetus]